jgi:hypothetical protein
MTIETGRLVPASAHDAERLDSYRRGTVVYVRFTEEKDRVIVRKWWAILGLVVKQCQTPWKTKEEASEAIKLALGIVNLSKTVGGQFMQYPKSLTELTDPELQDAVEQMMELIHHLTGVDPETLKKETAHIVDHDPPHDAETGEIIDNSNPGETAPSTSPVDDAAPASADADVPLQSASASPHNDRSSLILFTKAVVQTLQDHALDDEAKRRVVEAAYVSWKTEIGQRSWPKMAAVKLSANAVIDRKRTLAQFINYMATDALECSPAEIGG